MRLSTGSRGRVSVAARPPDREEGRAEETLTLVSVSVSRCQYLSAAVSSGQTAGQRGGAGRRDSDTVTEVPVYVTSCIVLLIALILPDRSEERVLVTVTL